MGGTSASEDIGRKVAVEVSYVFKYHRRDGLSCVVSILRQTPKNQCGTLQIFKLHSASMMPLKRSMGRLYSRPDKRPCFAVEYQPIIGEKMRLNRPLRVLNSVCCRQFL
jgi:hypothetical protein